MKVLILDNSKGGLKNVKFELIKDHKIIIKEIFHFDEIQDIIHFASKNNFDLVISAGGDGTINAIINSAMKLKLSQRKKLSFSVLPCGKANDLAIRLNINKNLNEAIDKILNGDKYCLNLIKVNKKYFITGGGMGLLPQIILVKNNTNFINNDLVYLFSIIKLFILGYKGVNLKINNEQKENLIFLAIMNQEFIGKRFRLIPDLEDNGRLNLCYISKGKNLISDFYRLYCVLRKSHVNKKFTDIAHVEELRIITDDKEYFMGDGEILELSDSFEVEIIKNALTFMY